MLSNKKIVCPDNLISIAKKLGTIDAAIVNAGEIFPMESVHKAVKHNLINPIFIGNENEINKYAKKALAGVQLPIAGFRGSGLAWMVDILSGVFTGGNHGGKVKDPFDDFTGPQNIGHLFLVMKPNLFVGNYSKRIKENIKRIKKLPKIKTVKEIMYPGQNKYARYKKNLKKSIEIPNNILKEINKLNAIK